MAIGERQVVRAVQALLARRRKQQPADAGKETEVAKTENTATPPATSGGIDLDALGRVIGTSVSSAVAEAIKPFGEQLGRLQAPAADAAAAAGGGKYLTEDRFRQLLQEDRQQQQQAAQQTAARDAYINDKLKDVREKLPELLNGIGTDPAKFPEQEQAVRQTFRARLDALGVKPADVGGGSPAGDGGAKPADVVDTSKLSGVQLIDLAVTQSKPITPAAPTSAQPAAGAAQGNAGK